MEESTPLKVIANVSRIVTAVTDRITGDRSESPLLVATAASEALKNFKIESRVMYGQAAWVEVLEGQQTVWAGCWGQNLHFWVATQFGEVVDLNTSVAFRKRSHAMQDVKPLYSPPMLWSKDVPNFYRYVPEGIAELELTEIRDRRNLDLVLREIQEKCLPELLEREEQDFPNEPIICPGRKLLDDPNNTFKHYERSLGVVGFGPAPI